MSGITNPAEEYFKDGLWAWDPAGGVWLKLIIDPLTNRLVIDHPGDLEVVQPTPADLCVANYGWDGSAWRKLPVVWGYSDRLAEAKQDLDAAAGGDALTGTAVPAGEVWVLQVVGAMDTVTAPSRVLIQVLMGAVTLVLLDSSTAAANQYEVWNGAIVMKQGDRVETYFGGTAAGDHLHMRYSGYKMKVAE